MLVAGGDDDREKVHVCQTACRLLPDWRGSGHPEAARARASFCSRYSE
jgi:hypothetical protein